MKLEEFLDTIYNRITPGMQILVPKRVSRILEVSDEGDIHYLLRESYKKTVYRDELIDVHRQLMKGKLTQSQLRAITTSSRTSNVSTIKWLLSICRLAEESDNEVWEPTWHLAELENLTPVSRPMATSSIGSLAFSL